MPLRKDARQTIEQRAKKQKTSEGSASEDARQTIEQRAKKQKPSEGSASEKREPAPAEGGSDPKAALISAATAAETMTVSPNTDASRPLKKMIGLAACRFCGMDPPDHYGPECPQYPGKKPCRFCGDPDPDHYGPQCPSYRRAKCWFCGQDNPDHLGQDCPRRHS